MNHKGELFLAVSVKAMYLINHSGSVMLFHRTPKTNVSWSKGAPAFVCPVLERNFAEKNGTFSINPPVFSRLGKMNGGFLKR